MRDGHGGAGASPLAVYAGHVVTLAMSEPVWAQTAPPVGDFAFTVTDGGSPVTVAVTAVTVASQSSEARRRRSTLTLSAALGGSATVSLTYTANTDVALRPRDAAGNRLGDADGDGGGAAHARGEFRCDLDPLERCPRTRARCAPR